MKEVKLYSRLADDKVMCQACAHNCKLNVGKTGICGVRINIEGRLKSIVYGKVAAMHVDPIEKKPLFHFLPGTMSFSVATVGCNMHCQNCQNSDISQVGKEKDYIPGQKMSPNILIMSTINQQCQSISYTYTEPSVYWDYDYYSAIIAKHYGVRTVFVTNGYFTEESLNTIAPYMDAANVDLKFFKDSTYKSNCGAKLKPVLKTIERMKALGIWVEVTTLLSPNMNDSEKELQNIAHFIKDVDPGIPWHVSRFYPTYNMPDHPSTPVHAIHKARQIGLEAGLRYVYVGNIIGDEGENTFCYHCGEELIHREGYVIVKNRIEDGRCPSCKAEIDGIWR